MCSIASHHSADAQGTWEAMVEVKIPGLNIHNYTVKTEFVSVFNT